MWIWFPLMMEDLDWTESYGTGQCERMRTALCPELTSAHSVRFQPPQVIVFSSTDWRGCLSCGLWDSPLCCHTVMVYRESENQMLGLCVDPSGASRSPTSMVYINITMLYFPVLTLWLISMASIFFIWPRSQFSVVLSTTRVTGS